MKPSNRGFVHNFGNESVITTLFANIPKNSHFQRKIPDKPNRLNILNFMRAFLKFPIW